MCHKQGHTIWRGRQERVYKYLVFGELYFFIPCPVNVFDTQTDLFLYYEVCPVILRSCMQVQQLEINYFSDMFCQVSEPKRKRRGGLWSYSADKSECRLFKTNINYAGELDNRVPHTFFSVMFMYISVFILSGATQPHSSTNRGVKQVETQGRW